MSKIIFYPGSFDPPTIGHYDLVKRGLPFCDQLIVGINKESSGKRYLFDAMERKDMFESYFPDEDRVRVEIYDGLTVDAALKLNAFAILRGLRTYTDFEYEFQMAAMNSQLAENLETMFIMTDNKLAHISSSLVRDLARHKRAEGMVSDYVLKKLGDKLFS